METEVEPIRQSLLSWLYSGLGPRYLVLLPLAALFSFVSAWIIVRRGKGSMAPAALLLVVHVPMLVGLAGLFDGNASVFEVIAAHSITPKPNELAYGLSLGYIAPMVGMVLTVPGYAVAVIGSLIRALRAKSDETQSDTPRGA